MRLNYVYISQYKNLDDFKLTLDKDNLVDVFIGKNASGKSNLLEALVEIFGHLNRSRNRKTDFYFEYSIKYYIGDELNECEWKGNQFYAQNNVPKSNTGWLKLPSTVLMYYSGHNSTISSITKKYETAFRRQIRKVHFGQSRYLLEIGPEYKSLLLTTLLLQPSNNKAREYVCERLNIDNLSDTFTLKIKRHILSEKNKIEDPVNPQERFWGITGTNKTFLEQLLDCIKGEFSVADLYNRSTGEYRFEINVTLFRKKFANENGGHLFRRFDNLRTIDMISSIDLPFENQLGTRLRLSDFSDGQFQSIYIYALTEIFKDEECLTLLDEPDAFLHPEWQWGFLKQISEISKEASKTNHILLTSHSAITLIQHSNEKVNFVDIRNGRPVSYIIPKRVAIQKLSDSIVQYREDESLLSIINTIQIEDKPVFFTEGSSDPIILKEAWYKLYPGEEMPFIPFYAFSCNYLKQLATDSRIHHEMHGLPIFGMFDFDKAYNQWFGLNGIDVELDPDRGLCRKWAHGESYLFMLPIPDIEQIHRQVYRNRATKVTFGGDSCCAIEHIFYGAPGLENNFTEEPAPGGGNRIKFQGDKIAFAKNIVPDCPLHYFETFRPVFEFISNKIAELEGDAA